MQGYTPITILETEAVQRRPDPRIIAAAGFPLPPRRTSRQRIGDWLISLGTRLVGPVPVFEPNPMPREQY